MSLVWMVFLMANIIAKPTVISTAAMSMLNSANICPSKVWFNNGFNLENIMKSRFIAFRMTSIEISIATKFRRYIIPTIPALIIIKLTIKVEITIMLSIVIFLQL